MLVLKEVDTAEQNVIGLQSSKGEGQQPSTPNFKPSSAPNSVSIASLSRRLPSSVFRHDLRAHVCAWPEHRVCGGAASVITTWFRVWGLGFRV